MLKIRLQRVGRRNHPAFRVVVTESTRGPKSGDNVELVGTYNPHTHQASLNTERIQHWIGSGAQVSDRVHNLLISEKIIEGKKVNVLPRKSPIVKEKTEEESKEESTPSDSAPVEAEGGAEVKEEVKAEEEKVEEKPTEDKPPAPEEATKSEEETPKPEEKKVETPPEKPTEEKKEG